MLWDSHARITKSVHNCFDLAFLSERTSYFLMEQQVYSRSHHKIRKSIFTNVLSFPLINECYTSYFVSISDRRSLAVVQSVQCDTHNQRFVDVVSGFTKSD